jgi:hypothetical protein
MRLRSERYVFPMRDPFFWARRRGSDRLEAEEDSKGVWDAVELNRGLTSSRSTRIACQPLVP